MKRYMGFNLEHEGSTYRRLASGWFDTKTDQRVPAILEQALEVASDRRYSILHSRRTASENAKPFRHFAVFTRNHSKYLRTASRIAAKQPAKLITFRSRLRWTSANAALSAGGPRAIYFSSDEPNHGEAAPMVTHEAVLHIVILGPRIRSKQTREALDNCLPATKLEGLWEEGRRVQTLYVISHCRKMRRPFRIDNLVKISDGKPLSVKYKYSYALVKSRRVKD